MCLRNIILVFIFFSFSAFTNLQWMQDQVSEDLAECKKFHASELEKYFEELDRSGAQVLYCKIRNGKISWKESKRSDDFRKPRIFQFFKRFNKKHRLADVDFIINYEDGLVQSTPVPVFTFSKKKNTKNVCLIPDFEMFWEVKDKNKDWNPICHQLSSKYPWSEKKNLAFFRGTPTGIFEDNLSDFGNDRIRVTLFSRAHPELVDATFSTHPKLVDETFSELFAKVKGFLSELDLKTNYVSTEEHFKYKYLLDVDGNASTYSRCRWILLSNSVLLKVQSDWIQWYYKALKNDHHFIEIKSDLSNLQTVIEFLRENDSVAETIALKGQRCGAELFSREAVYKYMHLLLTEYSKKLCFNKK